MAREELTVGAVTRPASQTPPDARLGYRLALMQGLPVRLYPLISLEPFGDERCR